MLFNNTKVLKERILELEDQIRKNKEQIEFMDQKVKSLRGLVNRKLGFVEEDVDKEGKTKKINDGLDELRNL